MAGLDEKNTQHADGRHTALELPRATWVEQTQLSLRVCGGQCTHAVGVPAVLIHKHPPMQNVQRRLGAHVVAYPQVPASHGGPEVVVIEPNSYDVISVCVFGVPIPHPGWSAPLLGGLLDGGARGLEDDLEAGDLWRPPWMRAWMMASI